MKEEIRLKQNAKTLDAVTYTHTQVIVNEIKKYRSRDRKMLCCFCGMQKC